MDTELDVLAESAVELVELLLVLGDLVEELEGLLDDVLLDDLHDLVLLKSLTRQVEWEILRVDNTLDEGPSHSGMRSVASSVMKTRRRRA